MSRLWIILFALPAICASAVVAEPLPAASTPTDLIPQIERTRLAVDRAVGLRGVSLELGTAILQLDEGVLIPTEPVDGRTLELVFYGAGNFRVEPPNAIEAGQLELFTGERAVDTSIESAVLVLADQELVSRLLSAPRAQLGEEFIEQARALHVNWLEKTERRTTGIEAGLLKTVLGDSAFADYFAVWARSPEMGELVYQLDPEDVEQLTLASFAPLDIRGWDRKRLVHEIRTQQRKGRWLGVQVQDLGTWDVWMSSEWTPPGGDPLPGNTGFESQHYELDVTIEKRTQRLYGQARIELLAMGDDRRAVTLELFRDLEIRRIVDGDGRELFFYDTGREIVVALPEAPLRGERLVLDVTYGGHALQWVAKQTFDLIETNMWYPHCGAVDRATYDVTLRWPPKYDLVSSGALLEAGKENGYRWERRRLDQPAIAFSFVMGDFETRRQSVGGVELTVAFSRQSSRRSGEAGRAAVVETLSESLQFYQDAFGIFPLDHLTVAVLPRRYSQSYFGFITLTDSILTSEQLMTQRGLEWMRDTTIAHEVAHQWWGNLVGWWSYRDQWLSEAVANYSALLFYSRTKDEGRGFLADMSAGWRETLSQSTQSGRTVESLGPIVLGARLNSSQAENGYRAIVYRKGAVVLAMLARAVGEDAFVAMLGELTREAAHKVVETDSFLAAIEKMSGLELDGFAQQFVYGTGIPQVYYVYETTPLQDGSWQVSGEARRLTVPDWQQRVVRGPDGAWDVRREVGRIADEGSRALMVPYQVLTGGGAGRRRSRVRDITSGRLFLQGRADTFKVEAGQKPRDFRLDPRNETLARFYSAEEYPKRVSRFQAGELVLEGRFDEAEAMYRRALAETVAEDTGVDAWMRDQESRNQIENGRIRMALARMFLDQGRLDEARSELAHVESSFGDDRTTFRLEREALQSRLEVLQGDYRTPHKRLRRTLRLALENDTRNGWRHVMMRVRLGSEHEALKEALLLLAITSYENDEKETLDWTLREIRRRGVDASPVEEMRRAG